jgi:glycine betaine/choline ABC-type transport system substrate-binding protein
VNFYIPSSVQEMKQRSVAHFGNTVRSNVYIGAEGDYSNLILKSVYKPFIHSNATASNNKDIGTVTIYTNRYTENDLLEYFTGTVLLINVVN